MRVVLPFKLVGQKLVKGRDFPKSVADGSKDSVVIRVDGIPDGCVAKGYFKLSWEDGNVYDLTFNGNELVVDEYIVTLPAHANNKYIDYKFSFSVAIFEGDVERLTTNPVDVLLEKSNYSNETTNTPEIPPSQFENFVEQIKNDKIVASEAAASASLSQQSAKKFAVSAEEDAKKAEEAAVASEAVRDEFVSSITKIEQMEKDIADLKYVPIDITHISNSVGVVEMGRTVNSVVVSWTTNKAPVSLTVDGKSVDANANSITYDTPITSNKTFTVIATDEREATDQATTSISFYNGVYYGVGTPTTDISTLNKKLQSGKGLTFTVDAGDGQNILFALPTRYGTPSFNVGGFDGGFHKLNPINFTNASGYTESYDVWVSDNTGLGNTTVKVS